MWSLERKVTHCHDSTVFPTGWVLFVICSNFKPNGSRLYLTDERSQKTNIHNITNLRRSCFCVSSVDNWTAEKNKNSFRWRPNFTCPARLLKGFEKKPVCYVQWSLQNWRSSGTGGGGVRTGLVVTQWYSAFFWFRVSFLHESNAQYEFGGRKNP